jgi:uncharacterized integral membrane protein
MMTRLLPLACIVGVLASLYFSRVADTDIGEPVLTWMFLILAITFALAGFIGILHLVTSRGD